MTLERLFSPGFLLDNSDKTCVQLRLRSIKVYYVTYVPICCTFVDHEVGKEEFNFDSVFFLILEWYNSRSSSAGVDAVYIHKLAD
jgi:hypothetical protein